MKKRWIGALLACCLALCLTSGADAAGGSFSDVRGTDWFAPFVQWAVTNNITAGTSATTFSPNQTCTVAQILTLLWKANGAPEPSVSNPFRDVTSSQYYYRAALWAYQYGVAEPPVFQGGTPCTRASTVTYLWRLAGSPASGTGSYADVSTGAEYAAAVAWAVSRGITSGTSPTTFSPSATCTRAQIAAFLYNALSGRGRAVPMEDWEEVYRAFVLDEGYRSSGQTYYSDKSDPVTFGLHDLDENGIPELLVSNGGYYMAATKRYVYTYSAGQIVYMGEAGPRSGNFLYAPGSGYPGLFFLGSHTASYSGNYYFMKDGQYKREQVVSYTENTGGRQETEDSKLYALFSGTLSSETIRARGLAVLKESTLEEIRAMGWDVFTDSWE